MNVDFADVLLIAGAAAFASVAGGLAALRFSPRPFVMSLTFGLAGGILLGTVGLDLLPRSMELGGFPIAGGGFILGFALMYGLDLFVHRGRIAGDESEMYEEVRRFRRRHGSRGGEATVLAAGTTIEELIEGVAIGAAAIFDFRLALLIAIATAVDNFSEGLNIGQLYRLRAGLSKGNVAFRTLGWTALIGINDLIGASLGWFLLRDAPDELLGFIFGFGGGGILYIAITDLVPIAQDRHYLQSAAIATAAGFLLAMAI